MKRARLYPALLWTLALVATIAVAGLYLNAKEGAMPRKVMMYYGGFEVEELFDASQWFASGMYKPRHIEADGGASTVTMLRNKPMPFTSAQYEELTLIASSRCAGSSRTLSGSRCSMIHRACASASAMPTAPSPSRTSRRTTTTSSSNCTANAM